MNTIERILKRYRNLRHYCIINMHRYKSEYDSWKQAKLQLDQCIEIAKQELNETKRYLNDINNFI